MAGQAKAEAPQLDCTTGAGLHRFESSLPVTASAIRRGDDLVIVAIGSSSTAGAGASDDSLTYPAQLAHELRRRWPTLDVTVLNKGVGGEVAKQMMARFQPDVIDNHPDLVIWQTGTNSLLYSEPAEPTEPFDELLRRGIRQLKKAKADVILMDPQYAPKVLASPRHLRVVETLRAVSRELNTGLFPRFAVMRSWIESGRFSMGELITPDSLHMSDTSYTCVARLLAAGIADAVRGTPQPMAVNAGAGTR